jgi:mono/diheme cytochrome c family protein
MRPHTRHVAIALVIAVLLLLLATVVGRTQETEYAVYSHYSGAQLYGRFCASCHGDQGHGDGRVAPSFKTMVPDLTQIARRHGGTFPDEQIRRIIDGRTTLPPHGSREMPVWGLEFFTQAAAEPLPRQHADELVARLTEYIRSLQVD